MSTNGAPSRDELLSFLASTPLFHGLDPIVLEGLLGEISHRRLLAGELLFRRGDAEDGLYVVMSGWLRVFSDSTSEDAPKILVELGRGEFVGEMALITGAPRSANVGAVRDCELVRLSREGFERLIEQFPRTMLRMLRALVHRMQTASQRPRHATAFRTIAVIPIGRDPAILDFIDKLCACLGGHGATTFVKQRDAERISGERTPESERFTHADGSISVWCDRLERDNRFVGYVADDGVPSAWTRCCIRQADRVLFIAKAGEAPDASAAALALAHRSEVLGPPRRDLVLLQDDGQAPHDTERWLRNVPADLHHNVRPNRPADLERLVRILVGRATGLVLSGGGARGFAHLGVLRALEEFGIPVDAVGGTSIGAVIAGLTAMGLNAAETNARCIDALTPASALNDYTLPIFSFMRCRAIEKRLAHAFGDHRIEDLWLTYFCVSTDMTDVSMRVHRRGRLSQAVRASISVPGLYPPAIDQGHVLIDGAVMNNLPAGVMREVCEGRIIGVDVGAGHVKAVSKELKEFPSPYAVLWNRLTFRREEFAELPNIIQTIMESVVASGDYHQKLSAADVDLMLRPDIPGYKLTDWRRAAEIAERGYAWAKPAIETWLNARDGVT